MRNRSLWIYVMMIVALTGMSVFLVQGTAQAVVTCASNMTNNATDTDVDGFTDYQECLLAGVVTPIDNKTKIYGQLKCPASPLPANTICLDPNKKDLFVIIVPASGSVLFPTNPLQYVSNAISAGGLGIAVHPISVTKAPLSRAVLPLTVTNNLKEWAVQITESLDTTSMDVLGFSNTGTPNGLDNTTIYTARIKKFITDTCGSSNFNTSNCADSTGVTGDALVQKYILHTIAHEVGHVLGPLAPTYNANYGGNHYQSGTNVIMDQSIYYTTSGGKFTFYIGTGYTSSDQSSAKLK